MASGTDGHLNNNNNNNVNNIGTSDEQHTRRQLLARRHRRRRAQAHRRVLAHRLRMEIAIFVLRKFATNRRWWCHALWNQVAIPRINARVRLGTQHDEQYLEEMLEHAVEFSICRYLSN